MDAGIGGVTGSKKFTFLNGMMTNMQLSYLHSCGPWGGLIGLSRAGCSLTIRCRNSFSKLLESVLQGCLI